MTYEPPDNLRHIWKLQPLPSVKATGAKQAANHRRTEVRRAHQEQLLHTLGRHQPGLLNGEDPVPALVLKDVDWLLRAGTEGLDITAFRQAYNFGVNGLAEGVRQGRWNLEVPGLACEVRPPRSNLSPEDWLSLPALGRIRAALHEAVSDARFYEGGDNPYLTRARTRLPWRSRQIDTGVMIAGATMLSGIVNGALVAGPGLIAAFVHAVVRGPVVDRGTLWLELTVTPPSRRSRDQGDASITRRYFPDPLTSLLLLRYQAVAGQAEEQVLPMPSRLLDCVLAGLDLELERKPTLSALTRVAIQHFMRQLPSILLDYARDLNAARSLPQSAWIRLRHDRLCAPRVQAASSDEPLFEVVKTPELKVGKVREQRQQYIRLLKAIGSISKKGRLVRKDFHALAALRASGALCPLLTLVTHWCEYRMSPPAGGRKPIRKRSLTTYLSAFGQRLVTFGYNFSVQDADPEAYTSLYEEIAESVKDKRVKARVLSGLMDFHDYLVKAQVAPPVEIDIETQGMSVDNNLVTRKEYHWACQALRTRRNVAQRHKDAQELILILGFQAGLRRSEVKFLRLRDLQVLRVKDGSRKPRIREVELFIEPHRHRQLKSASSRRRLPLHLLLSEKELALLVAFWDAQKKVHDWPARNSGALLFSDIGSPELPLDDEYTFDPVTLALKTASGDERTRFHHLRHSFGNRLLMYLLMARHPEIITSRWLGLDPDTQLNDHDLAKAYWQAFIGTGVESPSRKGVYALAAAMGHRNPATAVRSYLHVLDLALGASLDRISPRFTIEQQAVLLGVSFDHWRTTRKRLRPKINGEELSHAAHWAATRVQSKFGERIPKEMPATRPDGLLPMPARPRPSLGEIYYILSSAARYEAQHGGYLASGARHVAPIVRRSPSEITGWSRKAKALAQLKGPHGAVRNIRVRARADNPQRPRERAYAEWTPAPPHIRALEREAERLYEKLKSLFEDREKKTMIQTGMWRVLNCGSTIESHFQAPDDQSAQELVGFLNAIGIAKHRIESEAVKGLHARVEIRVLKPDDYAATALERKPVYAIQAIRYAVFMAAVIYGLREPTAG